MEFNWDDYQQAIATIPCRHCGNIGGAAILELDSIHFARVECSSCGSWLDWLGRPPKPEKGERRRRRKITRLGDDRCELCLRTRFEIPPPGELNWHHVVEHADGGPDHPDNLRQYCTSCHTLVNWVRTHFGHYHLEDAA